MKNSLLDAIDSITELLEKNENITEVSFKGIKTNIVITKPSEEKEEENKEELKTINKLKI